MDVEADLPRWHTKPGRLEYELVQADLLKGRIKPGRLAHSVQADPATRVPRHHSLHLPNTLLERNNHSSRNIFFAAYSIIVNSNREDAMAAHLVPAASPGSARKNTFA